MPWAVIFHSLIGVVPERFITTAFEALIRYPASVTWESAVATGIVFAKPQAVPKIRAARSRIGRRKVRISNRSFFVTLGNKAICIPALKTVVFRIFSISFWTFRKIFLRFLP